MPVRQCAYLTPVALRFQFQQYEPNTLHPPYGQRRSTSRISFVEKAFHPKYSFWESPHPLLLDTPDAFCLLFTYYLHISHIICLLVKYYTDIKCRLQKLKNILDAYCILKSSGIERAPPCGRAFCVLQYFCYDWLDVKLHPMVVNFLIDELITNICPSQWGLLISALCNRSGSLTASCTAIVSTLLL